MSRKEKNTENKETKICRHCQSEIPKKAKICPNCRKKQGRKGLIALIVLAAIIVIICIAVASNGNSNDNEPKTYTEVSADEMITALDTNAMQAEDYEGQYVAVTGELYTIDSDGGYFSIIGTDEFSLTTILCSMKDDATKDIIKNSKVGDTLTVYGQITDVGEVMGYSMSVDKIE